MFLPSEQAPSACARRGDTAVGTPGAPLSCHSLPVLAGQWGRREAESRGAGPSDRHADRGHRQCAQRGGAGPYLPWASPAPGSRGCSPPTPSTSSAAGPQAAPPASGGRLLRRQDGGQGCPLATAPTSCGGPEAAGAPSGVRGGQSHLGEL